MKSDNNLQLQIKLLTESINLLHRAAIYSPNFSFPNDQNKTPPLLKIF